MLGLSSGGSSNKALHILLGFLTTAPCIIVDRVLVLPQDIRQPTAIWYSYEYSIRTRNFCVYVVVIPSAAQAQKRKIRSYGRERERGAEGDTHACICTPQHMGRPNMQQHEVFMWPRLLICNNTTPSEIRHLSYHNSWWLRE